MKTYSTRAKDISRHWHIIDADGKILGKVAAEAATMLMGKNKTIFSPNMDTGDYVIVVNASKVKVTGKKMTDKMYYRHSMYPGGLKVISYSEMIKQHPDRVIEHAVKGMLPHNKLGTAMLKKLKIYGGENHPHKAQIAAPHVAKGGNK
jgi:large subunit ribosomal protein L13